MCCCLPCAALGPSFASVPALGARRDVVGSVPGLHTLRKLAKDLNPIPQVPRCARRG